ncbi:interleukin-1 receptor type 1 isoform X2 [Xenopus laevis]|uniref:Interleukin-1 receptor type 1 isoform X2 n=1 Tax=Xenopus laevis TaxID=8355 RepID=A0A8J0UJS3_XENLA|nr:interleukin-1 receptor type 1 isoform X2 [Xenopus laevis]
MHPFAFFVILSGLAAYKAQLCKNDAVMCEEIQYVLDGEPVRLSCCVDINNSSYITWFKNGSQIPFASDSQSRIHENGNALWFFPASLEDAGYYTCVIKNVTYCTWLIVFENEENLCYNRSALFTNEQYLKATKIDCPFIQDYVDVTKAQITWSKECQPLQNEEKYFALAETLTIQNAVKQDEGLYTCAVKFEHNGTEYSLSRTVDLKITVTAASRLPFMRNPSNNIEKVELGSAISLKCEVINSDDVIIWTYNDSWADEVDGSDTRVIIGDIKYLNFTEIKEEDYNKKFYCKNLNTMSKAYVMLQRPDPNLQPFLIAFFVTLIFVIINIVLLAKIFKIDIVLWYRSSCFARKHIKDGKLYDAYIMYPKSLSGTNSYPMDIFVLKLLPEVLEVKFSYRLFIFGRDEIPGEAMSDVVDEAISQSRRLVIVLGSTQSSGDLKDEFEQQIAMYDALIRNKIKVILVELEKGIDYSNMPESVQYIKQKQGVIRWKGELTEANKKFWKHMRYYMPPTQGKNLQHSDSNTFNTC